MTLHMACHARAQNMGQKAAEMLRLVPGADVKVIERCSGHGGSWGFKKEYFEVGMRVGRPVARQAAQAGGGFVMSECPLAGVHIQQGIEAIGGEGARPALVTHPIQILARAYAGGA
jgi:glycerol-3-phosphate dehydrogenase subunit C